MKRRETHPSRGSDQIAATEPAREITLLCKRLSDGKEVDPATVEEALRALHLSTKPLVLRLANIHAFCAVLGVYRFDQELPRIWELVRDLFGRGSSLGALQIGLQFMAACAQGQEMGIVPLRQEFLGIITSGMDCTAWRVKALSLLIRGGRSVVNTAAVVQYLTRVVQAGTDSVGGACGEGDQEAEVDGRTAMVAVSCLEGTVQYNFASIPEQLIPPTISAVSQLCLKGSRLLLLPSTDRTSQTKTGDGCLHLLAALFRFGKVPPESLTQFVCTLCTIPNLEASHLFDTKLSWQILKQVFESQYGRRSLKVLLRVLDNGTAPPATLRGSIFSVANACWGSDKVEAITKMVSFATIVPSFARVLACEHDHITHEVALAIRRLVRRYGERLQLEWDCVLPLLTQLEEAPHSTQTDDLLSGLAVHLLHLLHQNKFRGGSPELLAWIARFSPLENIEDDQLLLRLKLDRISMFDSDWLPKVRQLLEQHYLVEERQEVRLYSLSLVQQWFETLPSTARQESTKVMLEVLETAWQESDPQIAQQAIQFVVQATHHPWPHPLTTTMINILATMVRTPSAPSLAKMMALHGLFGMQPRWISYEIEFSEHQQQLFVLLTSLLDCHDLMVRETVLQFLLGYHNSHHESPVQTTFELKALPTVARSVGGRPGPRHCSLGVNSFVDSLINMLVTENDPELFERAARGVCKLLRHKALVKPQHLSRLVKILPPCSLGSEGRQEVFGASVEFDESMSTSDVPAGLGLGFWEVR